jgi:ribose 1,5-bisphosphokinase
MDRARSIGNAGGEMAMGDAAIIYVMGPSGAGKDSVLRYARARIDAKLPVAFAHRYITRPPALNDENHVALTPAEFALRKARGLFAMHWQAHGLFYGIGIEVESWRRAGLVVVVSGSRAHFDAHLAAAEGVTPVLVTCAADILAKRLLARGRETAQQISERLDRAPAPPTHPPWSRSTIQVRSSRPASASSRCSRRSLPPAS